MRPQALRSTNLLPLLPLLHLVVGCGGAEGAARWSGTVDTLPNGVVEVRNTATPIWTATTAWRVEEELRIGRVDGEGPDLLGSVVGLAVDELDRIWVLEDQAQEVRVFDRDGRHVRTIGRKGGGPGEFAGATGILRGPGGRMWVYDGQNNRVSVIDTAGTFLTSHRVIGGFTIRPYPGIFDPQGRLYTYFPDRSTGEFLWAFTRVDTNLAVLDTIIPPRRTDQAQYFEIRTPNDQSRSTVPYTPTLQWALSPTGDFWMVHTGRYEMIHRSAAGDTLHRVTREYTPVPVTPEDMDSVRAQFADWLERGATIDFSRVPSTKPAVADIFVADDRHVWVQRQPVTTTEHGRVFDVFDPEGRFLGEVRTPFPLHWTNPVFRDGYLYTVTVDDLEVPYVVRARIVRPMS
jgi:hypothetical protein